jgi:hypothetical protein
MTEPPRDLPATPRRSCSARTPSAHICSSQRGWRACGAFPGTTAATVRTADLKDEEHTSAHRNAARGRGRRRPRMGHERDSHTARGRAFEAEARQHPDQPSAVGRRPERASTSAGSTRARPERNASSCSNRAPALRSRSCRAASTTARESTTFAAVPREEHRAQTTDGSRRSPDVSGAGLISLTRGGSRLSVEDHRARHPGARRCCPRGLRGARRARRRWRSSRHDERDAAVARRLQC